MPPPRPLVPLSEMTPKEREIIDAWICCDGWLSATAKRTGKHVSTVRRTVRRYKAALREVIAQIECGGVKPLD
jgi:hypothetical protein